MIDLNQISMRLKNSAYALEQTADNIRMHNNDIVRLNREAENNRITADQIDEIIAKEGSIK